MPQLFRSCRCPGLAIVAFPATTSRRRPVELAFSSEVMPRRVGGLGVRAQAHSRFATELISQPPVEASQVRALRWSHASVRRRTDTRTAGPAQMQAGLSADLPVK